MIFTWFVLAYANFLVATSISTLPNITSGFSNPKVSYSAGGAAVCASGNIPITAVSTNTKLLLPEPANQTVVTEIFQELFQTNSTIAITTFGGKSVIQGTYEIETTLCFPINETNAEEVQTVQVLTYGIGLDKSYWDIAPGYSYVDAAATAGYATLAYNRLGVGQSDHPDPIQVVQAPLDVEILHGIVQVLRAGKIASKVFKHVIGVGHSYGSIVQIAQNAKYPDDVDAAVLTSFVNDLAYLPTTVLANNPSIASTNNPAKFGNLPTGYLVHDTPISLQLPFFRFPFFEQSIFDNQYAAKQTYTLGQEFTLPSIYSPAPNFTGPVDVVVGQHDFPFCLGECSNEQAAETIPALYPRASAGSQSYIVPNTGHYINAHFAAPQEFAQINSFIHKNGF